MRSLRRTASSRPRPRSRAPRRRAGRPRRWRLRRRPAGRSHVHEDRDQHGDVEQSLGEQRPDDGADQASRAAPSGPRGWRRRPVWGARCRPLADAREPRRCDAPGVPPLSHAEAAASAPSARTAGAKRVSAIAPTRAANWSRWDGRSGRLLFEADQTTPASARSETTSPSHEQREPPPPSPGGVSGTGGGAAGALESEA